MVFSLGGTQTGPNRAAEIKPKINLPLRQTDVELFYAHRLHSPSLLLHLKTHRLHICDLPWENVHQRLSVKTAKSVKLLFIIRFNAFKSRYQSVFILTDAV